MTFTTHKIGKGYRTTGVDSKIRFNELIITYTDIKELSFFMRMIQKELHVDNDYTLGVFAGGIFEEGVNKVNFWYRPKHSNYVKLCIGLTQAVI